MQAIERPTNSVRLGEFLKTRRARISPADLGLPPLGRRRTPGLRREEVAQMSGISVAYYTWMEQGRDLHMSCEVLNALARTLQLSNAERAHLFTLAGLEVQESVVVDSADLHPTLAYLFETARNSCAYKYDAWFNVIAATPLAAAVFGFRPHRNGKPNLIYDLFADPRQRQLWVDWEIEAHSLVGMFRQSLAKWPDAAEGNALLEALTLLPDFTAVWNAYDVRLRPSPDEYFRAEPWELAHWQGGTLRMHRIALAIPKRNGGTLVLCSPADLETASKFQYLAEPGNIRHLRGL